MIDDLKIMNDVKLHNPSENDLPFLLNCEDDDKAMFMMGRNAPKTVSEYRSSFVDFSSWDKPKIIKYKSNNVGYIQNSLYVKDRNSVISMYLTKEARNRGLPLIVLYKYLSIIFEVESYHKVEFDVYEFNKNSLNNFKDFRLDGKRRDERWYQGRYWDQYIFSLLENEWPDMKSKWEEKIIRLAKIYQKRYMNEK